MGNQAASMKNFPYEIGDMYTETIFWRLHNGKKKATQEQVTIFSCEIANMTKEKLELIRTSFKRMKTIRHPNFVKYLDGVELQTHIYVVTEYVQPLRDILKSIFVDSGTNEAVSWGLFQVLQGLEFLHSKNMYHGNISLQSVFVDVAGDWKIGELGFLSEMNPTDAINSGQYDATTHVNDLGVRTFYHYLQQKYRPPEIASQRWETVERFPDKLDSWGMACLIYEVFEGEISNAYDIKRVVSKIPKEILYTYNQLIIDDPSVRGSLANMLQLPYFNNRMIKTQQFLDNLSLKDAMAIESFLTQLPEDLASFPKKNCKYRILPRLIDAIKFTSGGSKAIIPIFLIGEMMSPEECKESFVPKIIDLFESNDRTVRANLLKNIKLIMPYLTTDDIEKRIYPNVANGFRDSSPIIREMTVKSMIEIVPKLTENTVSENVIQYLWALQGDKEPAIRTNTIIALGKLSRNFSEKTKKRILIPAFSRSLKDPFVHSRIACLKALLSTKDLYTPAELSIKVLPVVAPLTVDPQKDVRDLSFQCIQAFLDIVKSCSESPNFHEKAGFDVPPATDNNSKAQNNSTGISSNGSSEEGNSYIGWAVSSVSTIKNKISGERGHIGADIKKSPANVSSTKTPTTASKTASSNTLTITSPDTLANESNRTPVSSSPVTKTEPAFTQPVKKSIGLKLTHDAPQNDMFADMMIKQEKKTKTENTVDDMFANMSLTNNTSSRIEKTKTSNNMQSKANIGNNAFHPRAAKSTATSAAKNEVLEFTTPSTVFPKASSNNQMNTDNDLIFSDWDDMAPSSTLSNEVSANDFFNNVMNDDDIFGIGAPKASNVKGQAPQAMQSQPLIPASSNMQQFPQQPLIPTKSTPQQFPMQQQTSQKVNNFNPRGEALKIEKPKSGKPARVKVNNPKKPDNRMAQKRQTNIDEWEDWNWDE